MLIYSDMDGTMLTDWDRGPYVPESNLQEIKRLMNEGGAISIASGRQLDDVAACFPGICFNAPGVFGNGTIIQNFTDKAVLHKLPLTRRFKEESFELALKNDFIYLIPGNESRACFVKFGDERDDRPQARVKRGITREQFLEGDFLKLVYVIEDPARMPELERLASALDSAKEMQSCLSSPVFLETFSTEAGKGKGVRRAAELAGLSGRTLVCIGDYYNDEEMLRTADIAACPSNAPEDIRKLCDIVTCDNNTGAVADLIRQLERL